MGVSGAANRSRTKPLETRKVLWLWSGKTLSSRLCERSVQNIEKKVGVMPISLVISQKETFIRLKPFVKMTSKHRIVMFSLAPLLVLICLCKETGLSTLVNQVIGQVSKNC